MALTEKKKRVFLCALIAGLCLAVLAAGTAFLFLRTTVPFRVSMALNAKRDHVTVSAAEPVTVTVPLGDLCGRENVTFDHSLLLIDRDHPLKGGETDGEIVNYGDTEVRMNACVTGAYRSLSEGVMKETGTKLYVADAYRTAEEQADAAENAGSLAAGIGESEHQAGLAIDLCVKGYGGASFFRTDAGKYVNRSAWEYGFIIRYPWYGEKETGFSYEPWHVRYVGFPHAEIVMKNRLTLSSYLASLTPGTWYSCGGYLISRQETGDAITVPEGFLSLTVSPDNTGYYVVTAQTE